jgi:aquaporin Z
MHAGIRASRAGGWTVTGTTPLALSRNPWAMDLITSQPTAPDAHREAAGLEEARSRPGLKYLVEAIGTFMLVFTVGAAVASHSPLAPLAIGASLMVMVYAGGHLSGGHYNPAVTLAVLVRGRIGLRDAAAYWTTQIGAGLLAALAIRAVIDPVLITHIATITLTGRTLLAAFVVELLFTFALCYVVLNVATSKDHPDNSFYGLAIGFTIVAGAVAVGGISGGAFNPAVTIAGAAMDIFAWPTLWVYLLAQVLAGAVAGVIFLTLNPNDK